MKLQEPELSNTGALCGPVEGTSGRLQLGRGSRNLGDRYHPSDERQ
jgi:hypothetical protein